MNLGEHYPCLRVEGLERSIRFYQKLDFAIVEDHRTERWAVLQHNNMALCLFQGHIDENLINFRGGDIEAIHQEATARGLEFSKPMFLECELVVVRVFVHEWERAVSFYAGTLGLPIATRKDEYGWAEFETGACRLAVERLAPDDPEAASLVGRYIGVSLRVPDIQLAYRTLLERGVTFVEPPARQPWGGSLAHLRDPEENVFTLLDST